MSKIGVQLTDSPYVVASMRIMTRISDDIFNLIKDGKSFVKAVHSVGVPLPSSHDVINSWPCNPENVNLAHIQEKDLILSYGSGYGGNSLLGKKCLHCESVQPLHVKEAG